MDVDAYLERINYRGSLEPTAETLKQLQVTHLLSVPFENLSIHAGEPIILDDQALFHKIVVRRRGGFCYELNGLFSTLLRALGFDVDRLSAGVKTPERGFGPPFDHMTLLVTLDERWLVDVGFGDSFREPLLLDERGAQPQGDRAYRIDREEDRYTLRQRDREGQWSAQYRFDLTPYDYHAYAERCRFHQTSPQSSFTRRRTCSRATPDGRITVSEMRLITTQNGTKEEQALEGEAAYAEALRTHFGIDWPIAG